MNKQSKLAVLQSFAAGKRSFVWLAMLPLALVAAGMLTGCQTQISQTAALKEQAAMAGELTRTNSELIKFKEGDVLKITFPSSPTFDTTQQVRRDGRITMSLVGDVDVERGQRLFLLHAPRTVSGRWQSIPGTGGVRLPRGPRQQQLFRQGRSNAHAGGRRHAGGYVLQPLPRAVPGPHQRQRSQLQPRSAPRRHERGVHVGFQLLQADLRGLRQSHQRAERGRERDPLELHQEL